MASLEDLTNRALFRGVVFAERAVKVVAVEWHASIAITSTFTDESTGKPGQELLYGDDEPRLSIERGGGVWSMDVEGTYHARRLTVTTGSRNRRECASGDAAGAVAHRIRNDDQVA